MGMVNVPSDCDSSDTDVSSNGVAMLSDASDAISVAYGHSSGHDHSGFALGISEEVSRAAVEENALEVTGFVVELAMEDRSTIDRADRAIALSTANA